VCSRDQGPPVERTFEANVQGLPRDVAARLREGLIEVELEGLEGRHRVYALDWR
jgi:hypothetical protein